MIDSRNKQHQKTANYLTLLCLASTAIIILFLIFGPQEGLEAMIIILPWLFACFVHLTLGLFALLYAFKTKAHFRNSWIYIYFFLFFGFNGYYLAIVNQVDIAIAKKFDGFSQPNETKLHQLLQQTASRTLNRQDAEPDILERARDLVQQGVNLSYIRPGTLQPLIVLAARTGDSELVRMMLERGADVSGPVSNPYTPLMAAVSHGHISVVEVLLENGAKPNDSRYRPKTLLMVSVNNGDVPTTKLLLAAGADPDAKTASNSPVLIHAAANGEGQIIRLLLDHGADPNILAYGRYSPLLNAVQAECVECVKLLVGAGGKTIGYTNKGDTVLMVAIRQNQQEIIDILRSSPTPPGSAKDLFNAIKVSDLQLLDSLLAFGVSANTRNDNGNTLLLHLAQRNKYRRQKPEVETAAANILIKHGADINAKGHNGQTPLIYASKTGAVEMAQLLIDKGADVNTAANDGRTALLESLWNGHRDIASALIKSGVNPNIQVQWGINKDFPLHVAVSKKDTAMVKMLIDAGASVSPDSRDLCDLFQRAATSPEIIRLITNTGVDLNQKDPLNRYPLSVVMRKGDPDSIAYMIQSGAEPFLSDWRGKQPLMHFVETGQAQLVRVILDNSRVIRENQKMLKNAMYWAIRKAQVDVVRELMKEGLFYTRLDEVEAILKWAKEPPATASEKKEIFDMFRNRIRKSTTEPGKLS